MGTCSPLDLRPLQPSLVVHGRIDAALSGHLNGYNGGRGEDFGLPSGSILDVGWPSAPLAMAMSSLFSHFICPNASVVFVVANVLDRVRVTFSTG